ncbi:hypothetical protein ACS0PU_002806 [Formica fusca]
MHRSVLAQDKYESTMVAGRALIHGDELFQQTTHPGCNKQWSRGTWTKQRARTRPGNILAQLTSTASLRNFASRIIARPMVCAPFIPCIAYVYIAMLHPGILEK